MPESSIHIAGQPLFVNQQEVKGYLIEKDGEQMYCIEHYDRMDPFFMSIVSSSDLWLYLSSKGSLTAGRRNYQNALFPYETDDKIHDSAEITGPKTLIRISSHDKRMLWEPFSDRYQGMYRITRKLFKNLAGDKVIFEETNHDLQLTFSYCWMSSDALGWTRRCRLENFSQQPLQADVTDGLQNILPHGITRETQSMMSTLMDAYKVAETLPGSPIALYRMASVPVDRPEPNEGLAANCVWHHGPEFPSILLSARQLNGLRRGNDIVPESSIYGQRTAFFIHSQLELAPEVPVQWYLVADLDKDIAQVKALQQTLASQTDLEAFIESSVEESSRKLKHLVGLADGIQRSGDPLNDRRHFANVMFNIMRGGIFENNDIINIPDFLDHLQQANIDLFQKRESLFGSLQPVTSLQELLQAARQADDPDLLRLTQEYLPISFSRRHGDPSRPWNFFDIRIKNPDGSPSLNYQGNWRDIFQNWETLGVSFPDYLPGMICRFLNASTADGYNPYRITREGFDWEVPEPDNPWSHIGYWGDHQIIYLLKLLEWHEKFFPGQLIARFQSDLFVYANVPYRIKSYRQILEDPQNTIVFDTEEHEKLVRRASQLGADGYLLRQQDDTLTRAGFIEKLLVSLLAKISNLIPEAGIWLNTQRPEWNDANNALVGNGASVVTLLHLTRYLKFLSGIIQQDTTRGYQLSDEVLNHLQEAEKCLKHHEQELKEGFSPRSRKLFCDCMGEHAENYRRQVYEGFSGGKHSLTNKELLDFLNLCLQYTDQTIAANHRQDGLIHSYNLLDFSQTEIKIRHLYPMLEGQVAWLSSATLDTSQTLELMRSLYESELYRQDQRSFMLYPFRKLPAFMDKNNIPQPLVASQPLLQELISAGNTTIIIRDHEGGYHFNASLRNDRLVKEALNNLAPQVDLHRIRENTPQILDIYETVFEHSSFTGRSGSFYKYEGLGSIYWHMVSKLLLALGDQILSLDAQEADSQELVQLKAYYYQVKEGLGLHKNPAEYGAFPTDPYSHTPSMMGAQQPGMTGQVKEDILSRFNELGVVVNKGKIGLTPLLLQDKDFFQGKIPELRFSFCGTPFVYRRINGASVEVYYKNKPQQPVPFSGHLLPAEVCHEIFSRSGRIEKILVSI